MVLVVLVILFSAYIFEKKGKVSPGFAAIYIGLVFATTFYFVLTLLKSLLYP